MDWSLSDSFDVDAGSWTGGTATSGVLVVEEAAALTTDGAVSLSGSARLRLESGNLVALQIGDARYVLDYVGTGGVRLDPSALPLPTGHYVWTPDASPVLFPGTGYWDEANTLHSAVVDDPNSDTYFLFWTGEMGGGGYPYRQIGLATSTDLRTWTVHEGNPVLTIDYDLTTVDGVHVHMPTVEVDPIGTWHMYYSCYQNDVGNRICHATSSDGYSWTPEGMVLDQGADGEFDSGSLREPEVWVGDDGTWWMVYNGTDPEQHYGPTALATSTDGGWTWTKLGTISDGEEFLQGGGVLRTPYGLEQWYNCADVFCHAVADPADPSAWTEAGDGTVLDKNTMSYAGGYVQAPTLLMVGSGYEMWFNAYGDMDGFNERISHAVSQAAPGAWADLAFSWDGSTLSVTIDGATMTAPLASADSISVEVDGVAELDQFDLSWTTEVEDTGEVDTGPVDTGDTGDTAVVDTDPADTEADEDAEKDTDSAEPAGCGCAAAPEGLGHSAWALFAVFAWCARRAQGLSRRMAAPRAESA